MAFFLATSCNLHPDETFTGFCPSCLRERLAGLDAESSLSSSAPRRSTSALKSIFSILPSSLNAGGGTEASTSGAAAAPPQVIGPSSSDLRRCKSFSARTAGSSAFLRSNSQVVRDEQRGVREDRMMDPNGNGETMRPMKTHIDLESQSNHRNQKGGSSSSKDPSSSSGGNFWIKKWNSWRSKQKQKKQDHQSTTSKAAKAAMPPPQKLPKPGRQTRPRRYCDTQSELGGGGRRSCDTDPRFSVDAGLISFDCPPRFSFDEPPRASWDGYSAAGRPIYSRMHPTLSTVVDTPDPIRRSDGRIPITGEDQENQESIFPGSQSQTRDYYLDSSSRRRRSFERSVSGRKPPPQPDLETLDHRSNSKVSPAGSSEFHHFHHLSTRDELSESFDSSHRDPCEKKPKKWSLWGLIHKKPKPKDPNANIVDRSFSEAWPELRSNHNNNNNIHNHQFLRSNSTVSARNSFSGRRKSLDGISNGISNRSARFESNNMNMNMNNNGDNNGMLRFYLNPMAGNQSGRRSNGIRPFNYSSNSNSQTYSSKRIY